MADNSGWYLIHRSWMDNPIFSQKEMCQRAAWIWLIEHACWKPSRVRINGHTVDLERGQLSYSRSYLAQAWGWTESRVWRFINALKTERMIEQASEQAQTIITICNYNKYQDLEKISNGQTNGQQDSDRTATERNKKQGNEGNEVNESKYIDDFANFWSIYPRHVAKQTALKAYTKARRKGTEHEVIIGGARKYAEYVAGKDEEYVKHPSTWLNGGCWSDRLPAPGHSFNGKTPYGDSIANAAATVLDHIRRENDLWPEKNN